MKTQIPYQKIKGDFIHMVFFWLKNPKNQNDREKFEKALNKFIGSNSQLVSAHIGLPAATDRPVVDNSYTYSLVVTFPDIETHDAYQVDPTHTNFINEAKLLWDRVLIFDSSFL
ncbi:MAG: Dabb family protein [Bacteroidetes bacterium]|nr:Dabb family protein [Bacteroidota bacterium]MDA0936017.1 Dabb family protein [Bacteroidota bacterium]